MIKAYLAAFPMLYEGEDIEVRYVIYQDDVAIKKESLYIEYVKPTVVGLYSVLALLSKLEEFKEEEITIMINDSALNEIIKGACTTKNGDVLKMASKLKKQMTKFKNLSFINVTKDKASLAKWKEIIED